jgi:hypothetical protein
LRLFRIHNRPIHINIHIQNRLASHGLKLLLSHLLLPAASILSGFIFCISQCHLFDRRSGFFFGACWFVSIRQLNFYQCAFCCPSLPGHNEVIMTIHSSCARSEQQSLHWSFNSIL